MIWLPGMLSQGGEKYVWNRYAIAYGEVAGTAATVSRTYNKSKYASSAYTIQNGVFVLTNPVATTFENLTAGKQTVDIADSTNAVSSGATLYKVTGNTKVYTQSEGAFGTTAHSSGASISSTAQTRVGTSITLDSSGLFTINLVHAGTVDLGAGGIYYSPYEDEFFVSRAATAIYDLDVVYKHKINYKSGISTVQVTFYTSKITAVASTVKIGYTPYTVSTTRGDLIDTVTDADPAAYPENGIQDGYWYVLQT